MLETKCVDENYKMFETNIGIQSQTPTNRHQHHCHTDQSGIKIRIPTVILKIPGKSMGKAIPIFCYIKVIVFDLGYLPIPTAATAFPGIFNFTVGILVVRDQSLAENSSEP